MSIIKRIQPVPKPGRRGEVDNAEAQQRKKLTLAEVGIVASFGVSGLVGLFLLAWLVLPYSSNILPFMVASALPLFTLFAIIYQAVVYRRQWNAMQAALKQTDKVIGKMQGQLNEIQKQSGILEKTLAETAKIAEHSERSVQVARENTEYVQRAYVSITQKVWTDTGFSVAVENSGNTPAREVMVTWIIDAGGSPPEFAKLGDPVPKLGEAVPKASETTIFLGLLAPRSPESVFIPCNRSLTAEEEKEHSQWPEIFHWWVRGHIYYRDIFQDSPFDYRTTEFCFFYDQEVRAVRAHYDGNEEKESREGKDSKRNPN